MGTKRVIQLPTLYVDLTLYVPRYFVQELAIQWCVALSMGQIVPLWASYIG